MSRIGKQPIVLPAKVKVQVNQGDVWVEGPLGKLSLHLPTEVQLDISEKEILVKRANDGRVARANHGLTRAIIQGLVKGVSEGFKKELDISGVGYRAEIKGSDLSLTLGFSHIVNYPIPQGIKIIVEKQTHITITGADKRLVGQVASEVRGVKPPEPYKGKGVRYSDETVRRKAGKSAAGGSKGK
ncbi:MAG: 50S ribosomal protein L6 [Deltaproteobacteria bacterium]|nr:50S ribosomal protein L6 [Deltaproteobacteria bacterium]